jgi:hypothetical protein
MTIEILHSDNTNLLTAMAENSILHAGHDFSEVLKVRCDQIKLFDLLVAS